MLDLLDGEHTPLACLRVHLWVTLNGIGREVRGNVFCGEVGNQVMYAVIFHYGQSLSESGICRLYTLEVGLKFFILAEQDFVLFVRVLFKSVNCYLVRLYAHAVR